MAIEFDGFEWDVGNLDKCQKHGVSRLEIERLFFGSPRVGPDLLHSGLEVRFRAIGATERGRYIFVVSTFRRHDTGLFLRPISARYMHKKEVDAYEKAISSL